MIFYKRRTGEKPNNIGCIIPPLLKRLPNVNTPDIQPASIWVEVLRAWRSRLSNHTFTDERPHISINGTKIYRGSDITYSSELNSRTINVSLSLNLETGNQVFNTSVTLNNIVNWNPRINNKYNNTNLIHPESAVIQRWYHYNKTQIFFENDYLCIPITGNSCHDVRNSIESGWNAVIDKETYLLKFNLKTLIFETPLHLYSSYQIFYAFNNPNNPNNVLVTVMSLTAINVTNQQFIPSAANISLLQEYINLRLYNNTIFSNAGSNVRVIGLNSFSASRSTGNQSNINNSPDEGSHIHIYHIYDIDNNRLVESRTTFYELSSRRKITNPGDNPTFPPSMPIEQTDNLDLRNLHLYNTSGIVGIDPVNNVYNIRPYLYAHSLASMAQYTPCGIGPTWTFYLMKLLNVTNTLTTIPTNQNEFLARYQIRNNGDYQLIAGSFPNFVGTRYLTESDITSVFNVFNVIVPRAQNPIATCKRYATTRVLSSTSTLRPLRSAARNVEVTDPNLSGRPFAPNNNRIDTRIISNINFPINQNVSHFPNIDYSNSNTLYFGNALDTNDIHKLAAMVYDVSDAYVGYKYRQATIQWNTGNFLNIWIPGT